MEQRSEQPQVFDPTASPSDVGESVGSPAAGSEPMAGSEPAVPADAVTARVSAAPGEATLEPIEVAGGPPPPTQPIGKRPSRRRWAIALAVTVLVVVASAAAAMVLSSAGQASLTASAAPKDSVLFVSIRTDLPGDQRQKVAQLLAHFPGFADQSTLDQSISESLDKLIRAASDGKNDYSTQIKPWLGSEISVAVTRVPPQADPSSAGYVLLVDTKDAPKAVAWARSDSKLDALPDATYDGATLHRSGKLTSGQAELVVTSTGHLLIVGDEASVKASLDAAQHGGLDTSDRFKAASKSTTGDHLVTAYIDFKAYLQGALGAAAASSASPLPQVPTDLLERVPAWVWMSVRADSSALVVEGAAPKVAGGPSTTPRLSVLAPKLPGNTVAVLEAHDLGAYLKTTLNTYSSVPSTKDATNQIRQLLAAIGGVDGFLGWLGDSAVVVTRDSGTFSGGLVVHAPDAKTATDKLTQIRNLLTIGLTSMGATLNDETYNGTTITTVDLTDLAKAAASASPNLPVGIDGKIELAFAARDDLVVFGVGDSFVKSVLDTKSGGSLADAESYKTAIASAGASNEGQIYVDLAAVVDSVVSVLPADAQSQYATNVKPYVQPLRALALVGMGGDPSVSRYVLTVK